MNLIIYLQATGQILRSVTCPEDMIALQYDPATEAYLEHDRVDDAFLYIVDGEIVDRPVFEAIVVGTTIANLPNPTTVVANGKSYEVTDGVAELSFDYPGEYFVHLISFPYVDETVKVIQL
jgi:hypothetical protein